MRLATTVLLFAIAAPASSARDFPHCDRLAAGSLVDQAGCPTRNRRMAASPESRLPANGLGKGMFLIASQSLKDPNFSQTVVLLLDYNASGAMGLVINRPSDVSLAEALPEVEALRGRDEKVYVGGPVGRNQIFLLVKSASPPGDAEPIVDGVFASNSLQTLREIIRAGPEQAAFHAYAGYAGWGPGQLDSEMLRGDWLVAPADAGTVFDTPHDAIWRKLFERNSGLWVFQRRNDAERFVFACRTDSLGFCP